MFFPRILLIVPFLLLATLANSASPSNGQGPSPPPENRPILPGVPAADYWTGEHQRLTQKFNGIFTQVEAAGFHQWNLLTAAQRARVQKLLDEANGVRLQVQEAARMVELFRGPR
ncbi:hypothetical protein A4X06_0g1120 [Tilletia controversa]|uniref:Uncharacterized protein n=1 Tax=Tilletia controversa TaxID=13291 RepID=A0A8X7MY23_9BASI|nr:hypothetical protein CF328_g1064 [Tilletia controversa]KAE8253992.1 hypothetical protein A4X06_0g1120 [Tilletia controversa]